MPYQVTRRYLPDTNVLETTFTTDGGLVRIVDAINRDVNGPLAWAELAREVRAGLGEVPMRWRVAPGDRFGRARPWTWRHDGTPLLRLEDQMIAVVTEGAGEPRVGRSEVSGEFTARPGRDVLLALTATDGRRPWCRTRPGCGTGCVPPRHPGGTGPGRYRTADPPAIWWCAARWC